LHREFHYLVHCLQKSILVFQVETNLPPNVLLELLKSVELEVGQVLPI
jgi:hypothetical protein